MVLTVTTPCESGVKKVDSATSVKVSIWVIWDLVFHPSCYLHRGRYGVLGRRLQALTLKTIVTYLDMIRLTLGLGLSSHLFNDVLGCKVGLCHYIGSKSWSKNWFTQFSLHDAIKIRLVFNWIWRNICMFVSISLNVCPQGQTRYGPVLQCT